jgi:hypothetical protein
LEDSEQLRRIIALCDSDAIYTERFMEYFQNKQDFEWEIIAFTIADKLEEYLQKHSMEILLAGSVEMMEQFPADKVKYRYLLTEEQGEDGTEYCSIFRYQSVERIMELIMTDYMRKQKEQLAFINPKNMNITTVFSLIPGGQDISLAWSMGYQLARQRKVLLVPLELFSLSQPEFIEPTQHNLSEFIYYLKENSNPIQKHKDLLNYSNNLSYLAGASHGFDLLSMNKEDITRWITMLRTGTDFHNVIFYLSFYQESGMELLRLSDRVIVVRGSSPYEKEVYEEWARQMDRLGIDLRQNKFKEIYRATEWGRAETYHSIQELMDSPVWQQSREYLDTYYGGVR